MGPAHFHFLSMQCGKVVHSSEVKVNYSTGKVYYILLVFYKCPLHREVISIDSIIQDVLQWRCSTAFIHACDTHVIIQFHIGSCRFFIICFNLIYSTEREKPFEYDHLFLPFPPLYRVSRVISPTRATN